MPTEPNHLAIEQRGAVVIVRLPSDVGDEVFCRGIESQLFDLAKQHARPQILIDFAQIPFVQSRLIGSLVTLHEDVQRAGGTLRLCNLHPHMKEVLAVTSLDGLFDVCPDEESAIEDWQVLGG